MRFASVRLALPLALTALFLSGAGCFNLTPSSPTTNAVDGGVFRTADGGATWTALTAVPTATGVGSLAGTNVLALARDPQDPQVVYAGTRENGLFFSVDGGTSWQRPRLAELRDGAVAAVAADAKSTCTAYVAKGSRVYKTTDCLRSFATDAFVETRSKVSVTDVRADWYDPKTVWVAESNGDVQKSDDGGRTWRRALSAHNPVSTLIVSRQDSRIVIAGTAGAGFFRTIDGGDNWTQIQSQLKNMPGADTVFALAQDAKGNALVAATQYGLIRSVDAGANWEALPLVTAPGQVKIQALAVAASSPDTIAYATTGAFYRSEDGGQKWTTHQLTSSRFPSRLLADPTDPLTYLIGVLTPTK